MKEKQVKVYKYPHFKLSIERSINEEVAENNSSYRKGKEFPEKQLEQ
jgi:hypothetical protein